MDESLRHDNPNPYLCANPLSRLTYWWLNPLFKKGYKGWLEESDLYNVCPCDSSKVGGEKLQNAWNKELERRSQGKQASFLRALFRAFGLQYMVFGFIAFTENAIKIGQPILLVEFLDYFSSDSATSRTEAWLYATGVVLCAIMVGLLHHPYFMGTNRIGTWMRVSSCSLIYKKSLRLSNKSLTESSVGQIVNLMSNDVVRFDEGIQFLHFLWLGPLMCVAAVVYLWYRLGPAVTAALSVMILLMPAQVIFAKLFARNRQRAAVHTDKRVKVMNEIISGIRIIKLYCWEKPFGRLVEKLRRLEIIQVRRSRRMQAYHTGPYYATTSFAVFLFVLVYVLIGREEEIRPGAVFLVMGMVHSLRLACAMCVPLASQHMAETVVVIKRIQNFLLLEEVNKMPLEHQSHPQTRTDELCDRLQGKPECDVEIINLTAAWDENSTTLNTLDNISLRMTPGSLVAVIGPVGAGKTSLLMSILGELPAQTGTVRARGKIAYVPQHPWIFSGSLRQNILFGEDLDKTRYEKIIKICALSRDLSILPKGDATLIGDRGVNLSGGQKARVSLARALYMDADIYLLDDPLAAVDTTVGKHIFDKCIMQFLKDKTRLLVTHQVQLLPVADNIVIIKGGQIVSQGTYMELSKSGVDFSELLKPPDEESEEKDKLNQKASEHHNKSESSEIGDYRRQSVTSQDSFGEAYVPDPIQLPEEEERETGNIDNNVFLSYIKASTSMTLLVLLFLLIPLAQVFLVGSDWWLARWTNQIADRDSALKNSKDNNTTRMGSQWNSAQTDIPEVDTYFNLYVYIGIIVAMFVFTLARALIFFKLAVNAGENLHNMMFARILRATMSFFDTNPVGRVLNRFSKDTGRIDDDLPYVTFDFLQGAVLTVGVVVIVCVINPWTLIPVVPLVVFFVIIRRYYVQTSRSIKRLEGTTRSPVFSHVSATLQGLHTIRAMNMEQRLTTEFDSHQDLHTEAWFLFLTTSRWLAVRLDCLCVFFNICAVYASVLASDTMDPGYVGLSVVYTMNLMNTFQWTIRQSVELENQMISVERVLQYTKLPIEADLESKPGQKPPDTWPSSGSLQAKGLSLRYSPSAPFVLKDINFDIIGGEKIGIVGRTGAGKSSLITALFRLAEPEGELTVDGVSIHSLGLHDLRKVISIIPQDPVLFTGSVRRNLDPFEEYSDSDLWRALDEVQLKEAITSHPDNLYMEVTEGGSNFSAGQRQLMCLARAVLGNTHILMIDEATANVDPITDELIQQTIRTKFKACTVLTIAHRLHTIIDSDRIMLLDAGQVVEMGTPNHLLSLGKKGWFYSMVEQLGKAELEHLAELASRDHQTQSSESHRPLTNATNHLQFVKTPEQNDTETNFVAVRCNLILTETD